MASARHSSTASSGVSEEDLSCPICLCTFSCPATLACGHSFCRGCLEGAWAATARSCVAAGGGGDYGGGPFTCPQCRAAFPSRPTLNCNVALAGLVAQLAPDGTLKAPPPPACDYCEGPPAVPAVSSCLKCEMSFCGEHVQPHLVNPRLRGHPLVDVGGGGGGGGGVRTEVVQEVVMVEEEGDLEMGAVDEQEVSVTSSEEVELSRKLGEVEGCLRRLEAVERDGQVLVSASRARSREAFARVRSALDEEESEASLRLDVAWARSLSRAEGDAQRCRRLLRELQQQQQAGGRRGQISEAEMQRLQALLCTPLPDPRPLGLSPVEELEGSVLLLQAVMFDCSPTLDVATVSPPLSVSPNLRRLTHNTTTTATTTTATATAAPPAALCSQRLSSELSCWLVDISGSEDCAFGAANAAGHADRRCPPLGADAGSWALRKRGGRLTALHAGAETPLGGHGDDGGDGGGEEEEGGARAAPAAPAAPLPGRVVVRLVPPEGLLAFYDGDSGRLLHHFSHRFTQPLRPALAAHQGTVSIVGRR